MVDASDASNQRERFKSLGKGSTKEYAASVLTAIVDCSANDYFNIQVYAYDGAVLHAIHSGNTFSGHLIG